MTAFAALCWSLCCAFLSRVQRGNSIVARDGNGERGSLGWVMLLLLAPSPLPPKASGILAPGFPGSPDPVGQTGSGNDWPI
jgi:hypothetical protein